VNAPRRIRALVPALLLALVAACDAAPTAPAPAPPASSTSLPEAVAEPAPAPARAYRFDRSVVRVGPLCQEWRLREPPVNIACPEGLDEGDMITFEPDGTCTRRGAREGIVPCPTITPLPSQAASSAGRGPSAPVPKGSAVRGRLNPSAVSEVPLTNP
jgi:hypothetical protein